MLDENKNQENEPQVELSFDSAEATVLAQRLEAVIKTARQYNQPVEIKVSIVISDRL